MGYRLRLGKVSKSERDRFRGKSMKEVYALLGENIDDEECEYNHAPYRPPFHTELFEMGKYIDFNDGLEPFYDGFDIIDECECEFHIMTKENLKNVIQEYHELIWQNYI